MTSTRETSGVAVYHSRNILVIGLCPTRNSWSRKSSTRAACSFLADIGSFLVREPQFVNLFFPREVSIDRPMSKPAYTANEITGTREPVKSAAETRTTTRQPMVKQTNEAAATTKSTNTTTTSTTKAPPRAACNDDADVNSNDNNVRP